MQRLFQSHVCSVKCRHEWGPHSLWRQALLRQVGWLMGCEGGVKMGLSSWSDCRWCVWGQGQSSYACRLSVTPCVCVCPRVLFPRFVPMFSLCSASCLPARCVLCTCSVVWSVSRLPLSLPCSLCLTLPISCFILTVPCSMFGVFNFSSPVESCSSGSWFHRYLSVYLRPLSPSAGRLIIC